MSASCYNERLSFFHTAYTAYSSSEKYNNTDNKVEITAHIKDIFHYSVKNYQCPSITVRRNREFTIISSN